MVWENLISHRGSGERLDGGGREGIREKEEGTEEGGGSRGGEKGREGGESGRRRVAGKEREVYRTTY